MSLGRITASLVTGIADTTAALFNVNLDFSLVKIEAPREFSPVGAALSSLRREAAESGSVHTTARKLGALFDPILPETPDLIKAYGSRASEIATVSQEKHHTNYGVFQSQVGIDATSIWASATSGEGAIKAHLLACILARVWDSGEATAVWDEIVETQKKIVMEKFNEGGSMDMMSWMVAKQKIDRKELRDWDASARAWLCLADKVKAEQQSRFWLALDQFDLKMTNRSGLYDAVIEVWKDVLEGLELLVNGSSIELRTINLLLGLSALHLYPDMDIVTKKEPMVRQNDPLVPGILTVGLSRSCANGDAGIRWSLPLAHLQYYGKPIQRTKLVRTEGSRLTLPQFCQVLLGCVIGGWGVEPRQVDVALAWIVELDKNVKKAIIAHFGAAAVIDAHKSWLSILSEAAQEYLFANDFDRRVFARLIKLGYRNINFLGYPEKPFFGFGQSEAFLRLPTDFEAKIQILRTVAENSGFSATDLIIRYRPAPGAEYEFTTALPRVKRKRNEAYQPTYKNTEGDYFYLRRNRNGEEVGVEVIKPIDCEIMRTFKLNGVTAVQWDIPGAAGRLNNFKYWLGDESQVALFNAQDTISAPQSLNIQLKDLVQVFERDQPHPGNLMIAFDYAVKAVGSEHLKCLRAISTMANLYKMFLGAAIDVKVIEGFLGSRSWVKSSIERGDVHPRDKLPPHTWDVDLENQNDSEEEDMEPSFPTIFVRNSEFSVDGMETMPEDTEELTEFEIEMYARLHAARMGSSSGALVDDAESLTSENSEMTDRSYDGIETGQAALSFEHIGLQLSKRLGPFHLTRKKLDEVMAISSNDSLFIAGPMICTPSEQPPSNEIHRVTGNIGQGGIALLISPAEPRVRENANDAWNLCNHDPWDGKFLDCFGGTSLHLSYTGYNIPIDVGLQGAQDWEIYLLESVVSVHERGEWVADLDILRALQSPLLVRHAEPAENVTNLDGASLPGDMSHSKLCKKHTAHEDEAHQKYEPNDLVTLQNWQEFLNRPQGSVILLANSNWQAQLAAAAITVAQGQYAYVIKEDSCSYCVLEAVCIAGGKNRGSTVCIS
ncbi:hypothetical protein N7454_004946 [Penicillium verhagenii]|nr:hypothetical protein N7454_004946 [Penicillium verhagenii]